MRKISLLSMALILSEAAFAIVPAGRGNGRTSGRVAPTGRDDTRPGPLATAKELPRVSYFADTVILLEPGQKVEYRDLLSMALNSEGDALYGVARNTFSPYPNYDFSSDSVKGDGDFCGIKFEGDTLVVKENALSCNNRNEGYGFYSNANPSLPLDRIRFVYMNGETDKNAEAIAEVRSKCQNLFQGKKDLVNGLNTTGIVMSGIGTAAGVVGIVSTSMEMATEEKENRALIEGAYQQGLKNGADSVQLVPGAQPANVTGFTPSAGTGRVLINSVCCQMKYGRVGDFIQGVSKPLTGKGDVAGTANAAQVLSRDCKGFSKTEAQCLVSGGSAPTPAPAPRPQAVPVVPAAPSVSTGSSETRKKFKFAQAGTPDANCCIAQFATPSVDVWSDEKAVSQSMYNKQHDTAVSGVGGPKCKGMGGASGALRTEAQCFTLQYKVNGQWQNSAPAAAPSVIQPVPAEPLVPSSPSVPVLPVPAAPVPAAPMPFAPVPAAPVPAAPVPLPVPAAPTPAAPLPAVPAPTPQSTQNPALGGEIDVQPQPQGVVPSASLKVVQPAGYQAPEKKGGFANFMKSDGLQLGTSIAGTVTSATSLTTSSILAGEINNLSKRIEACEAAVRKLQ